MPTQCSTGSTYKEFLNLVLKSRNFSRVRGWACEDPVNVRLFKVFLYRLSYRFGASWEDDVGQSDDAFFVGACFTFSTCEPEGAVGNLRRDQVSVQLWLYEALGDRARDRVGAGSIFGEL